MKLVLSDKELERVWFMVEKKTGARPNMNERDCNYD